MLRSMFLYFQLLYPSTYLVSSFLVLSLYCASYLPAPRTSRRKSAAAGVSTYSTTTRWPPSWQIGTSHSSLSSFSAAAAVAAPSESDLQSVVAGLLDIKGSNPEHTRAIDTAVQVMTDQNITIGFLSTALSDVRAQLKALLEDLDLDEEASKVIEAMQSGILTILDLIDVGGGMLEPADSAASLREPQRRPDTGGV